MALFLVGGAFTLLLGSVRVRVTAPTPWSNQKASVIHVSNDVDSLALVQRAREGGPFPSRFDPSEWDQFAVLEEAAFAAARWSPPPYKPKLRRLQPEDPERLSLADGIQLVLPKRSAAPATPPSAATLRPTPVLHPLAGIDPASLPTDLPPFEGVMDETMTTEAWRFLLHLDASGQVTDCVSLAGGAGAGPSPLANWLRLIPFKPAPERSRWISIGVGFINQPVADGPDVE
jgi:hypothetical protein